MKRQAKIKIQNALVDLMADYPFQEISTKMICAYCNINRSTFYDHYKDKYDLLDTINSNHKEKFDHLLCLLHDNFDNIKKDKFKLYKFFIIIAKYIERNEQFFKDILVTYPMKSLFIDYIDSARDYYQQIITDYSTKVTNKSLFVTYIIGGQAGVFVNWLSNGCQESPEEVADILLLNTIKLQK
ncbi:TetR/AcrR family transcriptional regulator [Staphylococcus simiae]|uniref:TetR family regulatory protein n=1 Tax=Staphylococcus simiae CCM 7213 = CCUG 51256 TaxID=911238 RepID=G5JL92_9STAP|nr:TetR/AcrR family transcriptional regulator [Staphylococcus simiae]EHJ07030.1 TetR family regulatory protein [Staphylococcus simiae CCM 7213 = CCUG 51256]PNZ14073.1 TetR/AcrR family transcriptional regulator [Staphylococcus simiae]SNV80384.1 TetR family regulatory protein of MDR cluster [Staphylococcus simiae]